jgi:hypothetical protein
MLAIAYMKEKACVFRFFYAIWLTKWVGCAHLARCRRVPPLAMMYWKVSRGRLDKRDGFLGGGVNGIVNVS